MNTFLFSHGAGAGSGHPWMRAWTERLGRLGPVQAFDYPYMLQGRKLPDRLPKLLEAHRQALSDLRQHTDDEVILVGKSMGSRVACHLAAEVAVRAVICLGYPLVGGGKKAPLRDAALRGLAVPTLLVQGSRDPMSPPALLAELLPELPPCIQVHTVPDGDHSLLGRKRTLAHLGLDQEALDAQTFHAVETFVAGLPS